MRISAKLSISLLFATLALAQPQGFFGGNNVVPSGSTAPAFVGWGCGPASQTGTGGTITVNMAGANWIGLALVHNSPSDVLTIVDSQGDAVSSNLASSFVTSGPTLYLYEFQGVTGVTGETFSVTSSSGPTPYPGFCVLGMSGMAASSVYETGTLVFSTSGPAPGSTTPAFSGHNVILLFSGSANSPASISVSSPFTGPISTPLNGGAGVADEYPCGIAYLIQAGTAAVNPTLTFTGGGNPGGQASMQAVFKGAN